MKVFNFFSILLLFLVVSCGCCKEATSSQEGCKDCLVAEGTITYGDPAIDLCGWIININEQVYSLGVIEEDNYLFKQKRVKILYKETPNYYLCGRGRAKIKIINIIEIEEL